MSSTSRTPALGALVALLLLAAPASAQAPATDISLVELEPGQATAVRSVIRVTARERYDNQPAFLLDGSLLYTAAGDDGGTDIVRWDPETRRARPLISTPQSQYSPTPIPGRNTISVVRDYGDQDQQLWSFPLDASASAGSSGGAAQPRLLLPDVNPVGYHAWVDNERVLLFVLGEPPTLRLATIGPGAGEVLEHDPGRSLHRLPGTAEMVFVHKRSEEDWRLIGIDLASQDRPRREIARLQPPHEDFAISPDGSLWTARGSRLLRLRSGVDHDWSVTLDLAGHGIVGITRLAFDTTGRRLAVVHEHAPLP
ncbi:MAG TPA: hypothetical protein VMT85_04910 [Thermoanaerobaculia bacterium]|nr:hypothetical protein [Thermoanaerobaculia bacterium]